LPMQTLQQEGMLGLYRGMALPLATVAAFNAVLFSTRGTMNAVLAHNDGATFQPLQNTESLRCSSGSGVVVDVPQYRYRDALILRHFTQRLAPAQERLHS
jgi:hypothetical protein